MSIEVLGPPESKSQMPFTEVAVRIEGNPSFQSFTSDCQLLVIKEFQVYNVLVMVKL